MIGGMHRTRLSGLLCVAALLTSASFAEAQALRVDRSAEKMRGDGSLREWKGARFAHLGEQPGRKLSYALASTDAGLYVAADVDDDVLVREKQVGAGQDAIVLSLALLDERGQSPLTEIWLHPGETSRSHASGAIAHGKQRPKSESDIQVVEGPREAGSGYVVEAFVPWTLLGGAALWEQGRAMLRFEDVDAKGKAASAIATVSGSSAAQWPRIVLGTGQNDPLGAFMQSQGLSGLEPRADLRGNVSGDASPERVVLIQKYVVVYGPHYQKGEGYAYHQLPVGVSGSIKSAELRDVTGDGQKELIVRLTQRNELGARDLWMALSLAETGIAPLFVAELKKELKGGFVEAALSIVPSKKKEPPQIKLTTGQARGLDATTYQESPAHDAVPILLPWGNLAERVYAFDGQHFALVSEKENPHAEKSAPVASPVREASAPQAAAEDEDVLARFKRDAKLAADLKPSRRIDGNFVGSARKEQLYVFSDLLVIVGPDVGDGAGYLAYGLGLQDPRSLLYVGAGDVTGDGAKEVFVRLKQDLTGADGVYREVMLMLRVDAQMRLSRAVAAEVVRRQGERAIINRVVTRGGKLVIDPGEAEGFTVQSYPFTNDAIGGIDPLLLPWSDAPVLYRFGGDGFERVANEKSTSRDLLGSRDVPEELSRARRTATRRR